MQPNQSTPRAPPRPRDKRDFRIAVICALPLEASAVEDLFDKRYETSYDKAPGDSNAYSTGVIGLHNVVLAHMPGMGKVAAATAAACLRATFPAIELTLVVGICGGVPSKRPREDVLLGDVVVSEGLVQYDFGRQYPDNRFLRKDSPRDNLPRPRPELRSVLAKLQTHPGRDGLGTQMLNHLEVLRQKSSRALYPGSSEDKLFEPWYQHKHHRPEDCDACALTTCDDSIDRNCEELGCSGLHLVSRGRRSVPYRPEVHLGLLASGDTVMKSGEVRDQVAARDGVIAFEMEGVGIWEAFPHVLVIKGVCDYADSHKNKRWQAYAAATAASVMKGFLDEWKAAPYEDIPQSSFGYGDKRQRSRQNETLEKLYTCPYKDRKDRNPERVPGTCEWFTTHGHFQQWQDSALSRLLWVSADPGCGKSVLGRYLVDSIVPSSRSRTTCYFFFKNDFEDQQTATGALCCILHQLFLQKRELLTESIIEQFETKPTITESFGELWDILMRAARDKNAGEIVCFLDALDECKEGGRSKLIQAICKLYTVDSDAKIKFLLTSRPYTEIRQKFHSLEQAVPVIHLSGENEEEMQKISREIDIFVKAKVKDIGEKMNMRDDEQSLLLWKLTRVPNRTYLWVYLTLDFIESSIDIDKAGINEVTSQLPETVNDAYEKILSKSRDIVQTRRLLNIIVAATRPLTLDEMNVALSLKESHSSYSDLNLKPTERFRLVLRDLCGLFVTVVDSKIYLLHQTAKEFLLNDKHKSHHSQSHHWQHSLALVESDRILAKICLWHLLFTEFETRPLDKVLTTSEYVKRHTFLSYSAQYWTFHFRSSDLKAENMLPTLLKVCDADSGRGQTWWRIFWEWEYDEMPDYFTSLVIASYCNLVPVVKVLLRTPGMDLRSRNDIHDGRQALQLAASKGNISVAKLLLQGPAFSLRRPLFRGVRIDAKDKRWQTPLSLAAKFGRTEVVKFLLAKHADIETTDMSGQSPLSWAAYKGHEEVVKLLLASGADTESKDIFDQTPLHHASENKHEGTIKILLDAGANIDAQDDDCQTALSWAAKKGQASTIALLLDRGADIESKDRFGQAPLSLAARYGQKDAVKLLCKRGADKKSKDSNGRTPLYWAEQGGIQSLEELHWGKVQQGTREPQVQKLPVLQTLPPLHVSEY